MHIDQTTFRAVRDATCLAHTVPGVSVRAETSSGTVFVSPACLGADLDPCKFHGLVAGGLAGRHDLLGLIERISVVGGLIHLGAGLYQPSQPGPVDKRWFVTSLSVEQITELVADCPIPGAQRGFGAFVTPDSALGVAAVRVERVDEFESAVSDTSVDEVATWVLGACVVEELLVDLELNAVDHPRGHRA